MGIVRINAFFLTILLLLISSCVLNSNTVKVKSTKFAMGTVIEITVLHESRPKAMKALEAAFQEIARIDKIYSEDNKSSFLNAFNNRKDFQVSLPKEFIDLVGRSLTYSSLTGGSFDITVGELLAVYGFSQDSSRPPSKSQISKILQRVGSELLLIDKANNTLGAKSIKLKLALGGVAKGYAVDRAIEVLKTRGVKGALVNAGGDLRVIPREDKKPWSIGIEHPRVPGSLIRILKIASSKAVATSGDYQKYYMYKGVRYHHLINPKTGKPARVVQSATVIAPTAELADVLATAVFILGPEKGREILKSFPKCRAIWVLNDSSVVQEPLELPSMPLCTFNKLKLTPNNFTKHETLKTYWR